MSLDYNNLSDEEMLKLIDNKDEDAMEHMLKKYSGVVKKEIRTMYLIGAETEDLAQEGMIGLFKAVRDYEPDKGAAFSTFATLCVKRQIQTAVNTSNRKKHIPLNSYVSLYGDSDNDETDLIEALVAYEGESNPEMIVLAKEKRKSMDDRIHTELSSLEKKVLNLYLEGLSYAEIAEVLKRTEKAVNNALQRIRKKLSQK